LKHIVDHRPHFIRGATFRSAACLFHLLALFVAIIPFAACSDDQKLIANIDSRGTAIVCFGDSITAGFGIASDEAFPSLLSRRLGVPVLNAGRHGDTTADALARIDRDVLAHDPRLVIVEFGGNDFRKRVDKEETFRNLDGIVGRISRHGAMVVLLEIRIGLLRDEYLGGYRRVAEAHGALLIADFMSGILGSAALTVDGLHPNAEGQKLIAERVLKEVVPVLEAAEAVRRRGARRLDFTASLRYYFVDKEGRL